MLNQWMNRRRNYSAARKLRSAIAATTARRVEALEPRQLLSAVTTLPVPGADPGSWDGTSSHIVAGPDGNEWFTDPTDNAIGRVTPQGKVTLFPLPSQAADGGDGSSDFIPNAQAPTDIVVGPDGNLWFTENGTDGIGRITPGGVITEFHTPSADSYPLGLTVGGDGNLWFAESGTEAIGQITTDGTITEYPLQNLDVSYLDGIAKGADGNVWFIAYDDSGNGTISSITPGGDITSYTLNAGPTALTAGPDGKLWVGTDSAAILRVGTDGSTDSFALPDDASVTSISSGTDGTLWFSLDGANQFGRITPTGVVSEFTLPTDSANADGSAISVSNVSLGSDGKMWFVDAFNPQVGSIDLSNAILARSNDVTAKAGADTTSTFASFTDFSGNTDPSHYSATLTLSDGSTLSASVSANSTGGFDVTASHDWTLGIHDVSVKITDLSDGSRVATADTTVTAISPPATGIGVNVSVASGQVFTGTVAQFSGVAVNSLPSYSASIDWGDGHRSNGTITVNKDGGFDITGSHIYAATGNFTVTTSLNGNSILIYPVQPDGASLPNVGLSSSLAAPVSTVKEALATLPALDAIGSIANPIGFPPFGGGAFTTSTMTVTPGAMSGTGYSVQASSSAPFDGDLASFTLADASTDLSHLHATIDWADSGVRDWFTVPIASTAGIITSDGQGGFTVSTSANFTSSGLSHFVVKITDDRAGTGNAPLAGVAYGQLIVDSPNHWLPVYLAGNVPVPGAPGATGGTTSGGTDVTNPVLGEVVKTTSVTLKAFSNQTFAGNVGVLHGVQAGATQLADLQGTVHWGDGTTSPATFAGGNQGVVAVRGSHVYSSPGNYSVSVALTQSLTSNGKSTSLYPLRLPTVTSTATIASIPPHAHPIALGLPIHAVAGQNFTGPLASVHLPAIPTGESRGATIWWGDGTHSSGTLTPTAGGALTITGSHLYHHAGKYTVWIEVTQHPTPTPHEHYVKTQVLELLETTADVTH